MNRYDFEGRRAAVTGGASGIGRAIVDRLLAGGAAVEVWDLRPEGVPNTTAREVDVTRWDAVKAAADAADRAGGLDILVCSAGIAGPNATTWDYPLDAWAQVMRVNVDGVFHCCRAVVPGMIARGYGRIVHIASIAGKEGNPNASAYSASKAAVIALTKSLGKELAERDIAVNCITPAAARTPILDQLSAEFIDYMLSKIPRKRFVEVDEVAAMVAWLVSAENSFTTGAVFDLSGGRATY
ncbi:MAG TPA: SDR family NAD(P)-dependent oxidoreductase [Microvirga sp.]|nr:SDR family NAD(P)-dependent oxidoreductase [Microvirga sp.]